MYFNLILLFLTLNYLHSNKSMQKQIQICIRVYLQNKFATLCYITVYQKDTLKLMFLKNHFRYLVKYKCKTLIMHLHISEYLFNVHIYT